MDVETMDCWMLAVEMFACWTLKVDDDDDGVAF